MAAAVRDTPSFKADAAVAVFSAPNNVATRGAVSNGLDWDVTGDGKKFLLPTVATEENQQAPITIVLNWTEELKPRMPTK
jgi:hypothetical protein